MDIVIGQYVLAGTIKQNNRVKLDALEATLVKDARLETLPNDPTTMLLMADDCWRDHLTG